MFAIRAAFSRCFIGAPALRISSQRMLPFRPPLVHAAVRPLGTARVATHFFCPRRWATATVVAGVLLSASLHGSAQAEKSVAISSLALSKATGPDWARECLKRYPEVHWLGSATARSTQEGKASTAVSYSEQIFGQKHIEFDRTIMTLRCLQLILDGSETAYQEFTAAQRDSEKLSKISFEKFHAEVIALIESRVGGLSRIEMIQALETALVLGDIGKSEGARNLFERYGCQAPDHDDFHGEVMGVLPLHPHLCPSFLRLKPSARDLLVRTANLAHYGYITHLEGGPEMFARLKAKGTNPDDFAFDFFVHRCDIAGALGHVNNSSSLVYTERVALAMQAVASACKVLAQPEKTEQDAYDAYSATRAHWLGLSSSDPTDRALTRFGAMLRLYTPEQGAVLKATFETLSAEDRANILAQNGKTFRRTPTYVPAMLVNLGLENAVRLGLPFWARVLKQADPNADCPLNFNAAAGCAKTSPEMLKNGAVIEANGMARPGTSVDVLIKHPDF